MECKERVFFPVSRSFQRINRNILECKEEKSSIFKKLVLVLIETYWNVKEDVQLFMKRLRKVLIETYWNVKFYLDEVLPGDTCINRNILECKD